LPDFYVREAEIGNLTNRPTPAGSITSQLLHPAAYSVGSMPRLYTRQKLKTSLVSKAWIKSELEDGIPVSK
jgi:hypothetical protein